MRLLIVKLSALGDVIQTLPAIALLKKEWPFVKIDWVVEERNGALLIAHPFVSNTLLFKRELFTKPKEFAFFLRKLRSEKYTAVVDFQGLFKSAFLVLFSKAQYKIGFANHREGSPLFYNVKLRPYDPDLHAVRRYLLLARKTISYLTFGKEIEVEVEREIPREIPLPEKRPPMEFPKPYMLLVAGARWETKIWPYSHWETLLKLTEDQRKNLDFYFIGAKTEEALRRFAETMSERYTGVFSLVGKLDLPELVYVIKRSEGVITIDTGPMHLASLLNKPILALFGPTSPQRTGPWSERFITLTAKLPCQPCFKRKCKSLSCMISLSPEQVVEELSNLRV
ncbi:MAG: glycosyltransferase family 9 protein [Caldimicrobium sp.]|nr:glycosyltransferase family 9 protein [Caldimicrobium sp.]MCX7873561.1 glycosyltransferase family 9 protein [Caldimicrobium sp.]MDW8094054.1 glycosyltransferase family 9 protein [Caldimicrobium sp.]